MADRLSPGTRVAVIPMERSILAHLQPIIVAGQEFQCTGVAEVPCGGSIVAAM